MFLFISQRESQLFKLMSGLIYEKIIMLILHKKKINPVYLFTGLYEKVTKKLIKKKIKLELGKIIYY